MSSTAPGTPCRTTASGQGLVEFALVIPFALAFIFGIIALGLAVFYQQQIANAAREAARYAAIHSSTAQCPTVSWLDPQLTQQPLSYYRCDRPEDGWPRMITAGRRGVGGLDPNNVGLSACWSSYHDVNGNPDAPPVDSSGNPNTFVDCTIGGVDPHTNPGGIPCPPPATTAFDDTGSDQAVATQNTNRVTVYACYDWAPPMAGFLVIPNTFTLRAVVTEVIERQQ